MYVKHRELRSVLCDDLDGWDGVGSWEGNPRRMFIYIHVHTYMYMHIYVYIHICIPRADSLCCTAETNTTS